MRMLKCLNAMMLLLVMAVAVGCGGDDPEPVVVNTLGCLVTAWTTYEINQPVTGTYKYDSQNRLKEISNSAANTKAGFEYDNSGKLTKTNFFNQDSVYAYFAYNYNASGQLISESHYSKGAFNPSISLKYWYEFDYDPVNNLNQITLFEANNPGAPSITWLYTYPAGGKVRIEKYESSAGTLTLTDIEERVYDNQKKPLQWGGLYKIDSKFFKNNIITEVHIIPANNQADSLQFVYQYNANGYPTEKRMAYNGGVSDLAETIEYNCN